MADNPTPGPVVWCPIFVALTCKQLTSSKRRKPWTGRYSREPDPVSLWGTYQSEITNAFCSEKLTDFVDCQLVLICYIHDVL